MIRILFLILPLVGILVMIVYNQVIKRQNDIETAWSSLQPHFKQRYSIAKALLHITINYKDNFGSLLAQLEAAYSSSIINKLIPEQIKAEEIFTQALSDFWVAYNAKEIEDLSLKLWPLKLQLEEVDNNIKLSAFTYNGAVNQYNQLIDSFPGNIVAGMMRFDKHRRLEWVSSTGNSNVSS